MNRSTPTMTTALLGVCLSLCSISSAQDYAAEFEDAKTATKLKLYFHESPNFVWISGLNVTQLRPSIKAAESAYVRFKDIADLGSWKDLWGRRKCLVVVGKNKGQYRKLVRWFAKKYEPFPEFVDNALPYSYISNHNKRTAFFMHSLPLPMKSLPFVAAHEVGHLAIWCYRTHHYFCPPWLVEGMGIYLEARTMNRTQCYCFGGGYGDAAGSAEKMFNIEWRKWKQIVRQAAKKRNDKDLKGILKMRFNQLGSEEIGKCWSVIDYLILKDKRAFARFLRRIKDYWPKDGPPRSDFTPEKLKAQDRALRDAYGMSLEELDTAWRAWASKGMKKIE